jgi:hypothetical protein
MVTLLKDWMIAQGCVNSSWVAENDNMLRYGWSNGEVLKTKAVSLKVAAPAACPHLTVVHNEVDCVDGENLMAQPSARLLPPLSQKKPAALPSTGALPPRLVFFTTLRDPIERIGSQAFYVNGIGREIVHQFVLEMCGPHATVPCQRQDTPMEDGSKTEALCECTERAVAAAHAKLASSPELWLRWMNSSKPQHWQTDFYSRNYYIRRLTSGPHPIHEGLGPLDVCMRDPSQCWRLSPEQVDAGALRQLGWYCFCNEHTTHEPSDYDAALQLAKAVLRDQFEFLITERMEQPETEAVLRRVLGSKFRLPGALRTNVAKVFTRTGGDQIHENTTTKGAEEHSSAPGAEERSYTDLIPPSVLSLLRRENSHDLELYRFAVELFEARAAASL